MDCGVFGGTELNTEKFILLRPYLALIERHGKTI